MSAQRYLKLNQDGKPAEQPAIDVSVGPGDAGKIVALNNSGVLDPSLLPPGVATDTIAAQASEALSAGDFVYFRPDRQVAKAIATSAASLAMGFVLTSATSGEQVNVYLDTRNSALTNLTPGTQYFLSSSVAGAVTASVVSTPGHYVQSLGRAVSDTTLSVEISDGIQRA
jgi:hypothetical protein